MVTNNPIRTLIAIGKVLINMERIVEMKIIDIKKASSFKPAGEPNIQSTKPINIGEIVLRLYNFILVDDFKLSSYKKPQDNEALNFNCNSMPI
tara:strand:+ start:10599 stop:10877 length:279 start_codon:yes stop_codon:yes gene_type:complete